MAFMSISRYLENLNTPAKTTRKRECVYDRLSRFDSQIVVTLY